MSYVHICPNCKGVFKYPTDGTYSCPDCKVQMLASGFTDTAWAALPPAERNKIKRTLYTDNYAKQIEQQREKDAKLATILISSGFNFDGYRIIKYSGYISGDDAVQIPRSGVFGGNNGQNLTDALVQIRRQA